MSGRFIVFEGIDGCGKTTQSALLERHFVARGLPVMLTRQPGATNVGASLRALLLDPDGDPLDSRTEAMLMAADRAEHVARMIRPSLAAGTHVICDRYTASSVAYQGYGRGLDPEEVSKLSGWATDDLRVDLNVLIDVPPLLGLERVGANQDRIEREGLAFAERVAEGFAAQAAEDPERWLVLDGTQKIDELAAAVERGVTERLGDLGE